MNFEKSSEGELSLRFEDDAELGQKPVTVKSSRHSFATYFFGIGYLSRASWSSEHLNNGALTHVSHELGIISSRDRIMSDIVGRRKGKM